jgi:hypothetical protein
MNYSFPRYVFFVHTEYGWITLYRCDGRKSVVLLS